MTLQWKPEPGFLQGFGRLQGREGAAHSHGSFPVVVSLRLCVRFELSMPVQLQLVVLHGIQRPTMVKTGSCNANSQQQSAQIAVAEAVANAGFTASQVFAAALRFQRMCLPRRSVAQVIMQQLR